MIMKKIFAIVLFAAALSGCGYDWVNRGRPGADYFHDESTCRMEALRTFPDVPVVIQPEAPRYMTNCSRIGNSTSCDSIPLRSTQAYTVAQEQANKTTSSRNSYVSSCMTAKGWRLEKIR